MFQKTKVYKSDYTQTPVSIVYSDSCSVDILLCNEFL